MPHGLIEWLKLAAPAFPLVVAAAGLFAFAGWRWRTRFERGNGRPAAHCPYCGEAHQRGLPMQWHVEHRHLKGTKSNTNRLKAGSL